MKKNILVLLLILIFSPLNAQNHEEGIRRQFREYNQLVLDKKINEALDYTIEDLFTIIPREQMVNMMESVLNTPSMEFRGTIPEITDMEPVREIEGASYVRFKNKAIMEVKFLQSPDEPKRTPEEEQEYNTMLMATLQEQYGEEYVTFDAQSGFYKTVTIKTVIAKSKDLKNWKFAILDSPTMKVLLGKFIPKELLD
ncbi:hypothetical protein ACI6PS_15135 [Flavobacterium sp. PLA-1-15]|uniref:hypothetical protein n=1 Tax=Flavobacterium sp. PLA-1-15 TaxID=3380533 RepID=UPI003B79479D